MNKVMLVGRLARDPEIRYSSGENQTVVARYTLAVGRGNNGRVMPRLRILSAVLYLGRGRSLQKITSTRVQKL